MSGLLGSVRVLDLSDGPLSYAGRMLADLGADVVLIEPPGGAAARLAPPVHPRPSGQNLSAVFAFTAAGKRSVTIDLHRQAGRAVFERLVSGADVVYSTAPVGQLERLGLGHQRLLGDYPRLIFASVTPYGLRGPRRRWRGSDLTAWASSGALPMYGDPDRPPLTPREDLALTAGALNAVMGVTLALQGRQLTGRGQLVERVAPGGRAERRAGVRASAGAGQRPDAAPGRQAAGYPADGPLPGAGRRRHDRRLYPLAVACTG